MVINKKLFRNDRSNNLRFIGSILIIAICICMYVSFASSMWSLYYNLEDYRKECKMHDYEMTVSSEISNEENIEEKHDVELEKRYYCEIKCDDGDIIKVMSANEEVDKYKVRQGENLKEKNDLLIDEQYAKKNNYDIGSQIKIGKDTFTIKGFFIEPDYSLVTNSIKGISVNHTSYGIAIVSKERAKEISQAAVEYLVYCNSDAEKFDKESFLGDVYSSTAIEKFISIDSDNRATYIDNDIRIYTKGMQIIPFCLMIVSCLVVGIILGKLLKAETVEIGILYSFGYRPFDLYKHYSFYSLFIAISGGVLGIVMGMFLAPVLKGIVTERYCVPEFSISLELKTVLVSILVPLILLGIICTVFILMKLLQSPLTLIHNQSSKKSKNNFRGLKMNSASFVSRFRIREILRNVPKYVFMIFGVSTSALMLLLFASILGSINKMMDDSFSKIFKYEYMYTFNDIMVVKPDGYRTNVTYFMLDDEEVSVNGVDINNKHMCFEDTDGNLCTFEDNVITVNLANQHDVKAGDTVKLKNRITGDEYDLKIDRIIVSYAEDFIAMPLEQFNTMFGYPKDSYTIVTSDKELDVDNEKILSIQSKKNSRESIDDTLKPLKGIMLSMMAMAAIVAFILMTIIISIILEDSKFTISLLKILGYNEKRISKMMLDFNRYIVIIALGVSLPLILLASSTIMGKLSEMMGMYIPPYLNPVHAVIGFVLLYGNFILVKIIMKKRILAIDPADTLKSRE